MRPGWWRRNLWGLLALVPAMAAALYLPAHDWYTQYTASTPAVPIQSAPGGWVGYAGARIRLVSLAPANDLKTYDGTRFDLPGVRAWRAELAFDTPRPDGIAGCELTVEAADGRWYGEDPAELYGVDVPTAGCTPDSSTAGAARPYQRAVYFVLPRTARAVAVRMVLATKLPRYARLLPG